MEPPPRMSSENKVYQLPVQIVSRARSALASVSIVNSVAINIFAKIGSISQEVKALYNKSWSVDAEKSEQVLRNEVVRAAHLMNHIDDLSVAKHVVRQAVHIPVEGTQQALKRICQARNSFLNYYNKWAQLTQQYKEAGVAIDVAYRFLREVQSDLIGNQKGKQDRLSVFSLPEFLQNYASALAHEKEQTAKTEQLQNARQDQRQQIQLHLNALEDSQAQRISLESRLNHLAATLSLLNCPLTGKPMSEALSWQAGAVPAIHFDASSLGIISVHGVLMVKEVPPLDPKAVGPFIGRLAPGLGVPVKVLADQIAAMGWKAFIEAHIIPNCRPSYAVASIGQHMVESKGRTFLDLPEDDFSDPIYFEIYNDPVILKCGHSFNRVSAQEHNRCPCCRADINLAQSYANPLLAALASTYNKKDDYLDDLAERPELEKQKNAFDEKIAAKTREIEALKIDLRKLEDDLSHFENSARALSVSHSKGAVLHVCELLSNAVGENFVPELEIDKIPVLFSQAEKYKDAAKKQMDALAVEIAAHEIDLKFLQELSDQAQEKASSESVDEQLEDLLSRKFLEDEETLQPLFESGYHSLRAERENQYLNAQQKLASFRFYQSLPAAIPSLVNGPNSLAGHKIVYIKPEQ